MTKSLDEVLGHVPLSSPDVEVAGLEAESEERGLQVETEPLSETPPEVDVAEVAEVIAHGLPEHLVGSLRQTLGTDAEDVFTVLRASLASSNEKIALDAAKLVLDVVHKLPGRRVVGAIPQTPQEVEELGFAELQAAVFVLVSGQAEQLAGEHGEEEAARRLWEKLSPTTRAVVLRAAA